MIEYLVLLLAFPVGIVLARFTGREREIFSKAPYFPIMIWVLAVLASVFLIIDKVVGFSLLFAFLTVLVWQKFD